MFQLSSPGSSWVLVPGAAGRHPPAGQRASAAPAAWKKLGRDTVDVLTQEVAFRSRTCFGPMMPPSPQWHQLRYAELFAGILGFLAFHFPFVRIPPRPLRLRFSEFFTRTSQGPLHPSARLRLPRSFGGPGSDFVGRPSSAPSA